MFLPPPKSSRVSAVVAFAYVNWPYTVFNAVYANDPVHVARVGASVARSNPARRLGKQLKPYLVIRLETFRIVSCVLHCGTFLTRHRNRLPME